MIFCMKSRNWSSKEDDWKAERCHKRTHFLCRQTNVVLRCFTSCAPSLTKTQVCMMWSETVGLRTRPKWDQKIRLSLGLAVLVLFCETRSCNARHNDLEGHSNLLSTTYSFCILCLQHHYCGDQQWRSLTWRTQVNGLPQGSVLSPTTFNLYDNDIPVTGSRKFIYADDICLTKHATRYLELECCLSSDMVRMASYCRLRRLKPSPMKKLPACFIYSTPVQPVSLGYTWKASNSGMTQSQYTLWWHWTELWATGNTLQRLPESSKPR